MSTRAFFHAIGIIFLLIAILHLLRLIFAWEAQIGGVVIPMWVSVIVVVVAGFLVYQSFKLEKRK